MAKKRVDDGEIDLDSVDFDDFDFDVPEFDDPDPTKDDRSPVTKLGAGFAEGFKSSALDASAIKSSLGKALPRGYGQAINVFDSSSDTARELYHSVASDLRPATDGLRAATRMITPKIKSKLPKRLSDKLESFGEGAESNYKYSASKLKQESEDSQIANTIADLFQQQANRETEIMTNDHAEDAVRDAVDNKRHKESTSQMTVVAQGISRLVGYQDAVLSKYQQKSLELQYRHYFVAKDLLDISNVHNEKVIAAFEKVVKNTALPEATKIQQSELAGQMLKERMIGSAFNNIGNWTRNFASNLKDNVTGTVKGFTDNISGARDMGGQVVDQFGVAKGAGFAGGAMAADKVHDFASTRLAPMLDNVPGLRKFGARMGNFLTSAPRKLNKYAKSETEGSGWLSIGEQMIKDMLPKHYLDDKITSNALMASDQPATFDNLTRRSIVEIIPGWLSQINRWTKAMATGQLDSDDEMDVYNLEKGEFSSRGNYLKDIKRRVLPAGEIAAMRQSMNDFMAELDSENQLSDGATAALKKKLLSDTANGEDFDPADLTKREFYHGVADEHVDDLRYFFRNKFGVDIDGGVDGSTENLDAIGEFKAKFNGFANTLPNSGDYIRTLHETMGKDNFKRLGLVNRIGNQDTIDYNRIFETILNESGLDTVVNNDEARREYSLNPTFAGRGLPTPAPSVLPQPIAPPVLPQAGAVRSDLGEWLGKDSLLIREILGLNEAVKANNVSELVAQQAGLLAEINSKIGYIGSGEPGPGGPRPSSDLWNKAKGGMGMIGRAGKGYFNATMSMYKNLGKGSLWTGNKLFQGAKAIGKGLIEKGNNIDIFVRGQGIAALRDRLLQAGEYIDVNTKKVIRDVKDITGEVRDRRDNIIISEAEFAQGLVSKHGKSLLGRVTSLAGKAAKGIGGLYAMPFKAIWNAGASAAKIWSKKKLENMDLKLRGEKKPRMRKHIMDAGGYFDQATKKVIRHYSDITGTVVDAKNNIVVTLEEIEASGGLFDAAGKLVTKGVGKLAIIATTGLQLYGKAIMAPFKAVKWAGKKAMAGIRRLFGGGKMASKFSPTGENDADLVTLSYYQLTVQEKMYNFMKDNLTKKRKKHDADGDGVRDGSLKDLLAKRKAKKEEEAARKANGEEDKKGLWGSIGGMLSSTLGKLFGKKKDSEGEEGGGGIDVDYWGGGGKDGKKKGRGGRRGRGPRAPRGKFGRLGQGARWLGTKAGAAKSFIGRQALWQGARMAAVGLAGLLSAPVVLGAAAAAVVGYGAYKLYKHIADKPTPIRGMRYAQYGINVRSAEQIGPITYLEEQLLKGATYNDEGPATLSASHLDTTELLKQFGIDANSQDEDVQERIGKFNRWLQMRFMPVFVSHITVLNRLAKDVKLPEVDEKLPIPQGLDYIKGTRNDELKEAYNNLDDSPFDDELENDAGDVESWVKDAIDFYTKKMKDQPTQAAAAPTTAKIDPMTGKPVVAAASAGAVTAASMATGETRKIGGFGAKVDGLGKKLLTTAVAPLAVAGALFAGWNAIKDMRGKALTDRQKPKLTLDALTSGRYKVYGLKELDLDKVDAIYNLEEAMWNDVTYDGDKAAFYEGTPDAIYPIVKDLFKVADTDASHRADWFNWYRFRFLPAFLQFCTAVRAVQSIDARHASSKLTIDEQHRVLMETSSATSTYEGMGLSVWLIEFSPWKDYYLNKDEETIAGNLEALKSAAKRSSYKDTMQNVTNTGAEIALARRQENMAEDGGFRLPGSDPEKDSANKPGWFDRTMNTMFGSRDPSGDRTGGWFGSEADPSKDHSGGTAAPLNGGMVIQNHPGGGTGGDINDIPSPTGAGWEASKATILAAAKMAGFDPTIAATVAGLESKFDPAARPWKKPRSKSGGTLSSAGGYYQFLDDTWKEMLKNYGAKYGLAPDASKYDGRANALMGMEFLKENQAALGRRLGRPITDTDLYAAHFLGANGAGRFLSAPPGSDARHAVGSTVPSSNPSVFFGPGGSARTVSGVYAELDKRMDIARKMHDIQPGFSFNETTVDEQGNVTDTSPEGTGNVEVTPTSTTEDTVGVMAMQGDPTSESNPEAAATSTAEANRVANAGRGTFTPVAMATGRESAAAQGIQPRSSTGLSVIDPEATERSSPTIAAATAQKQSSIESNELNSSLVSVSAIMSQQLGVQTAMDGKLAAIIQLLKAKEESDGKTDKQPSQTSASRVPTPDRNVPKPANSLSNVPVNVDRKRVS